MSHTVSLTVINPPAASGSGSHTGNVSNITSDEGPCATTNNNADNASPANRNEDIYSNTSCRTVPITTDSSPSAPSRTLLQTATIMVSLCACVFVAALEITIVSAALPTISAYFDSPSGYTWIGTAVSFIRHPIAIGATG